MVQERGALNAFRASKRISERQDTTACLHLSKRSDLPDPIYSSMRILSRSRLFFTPFHVCHEKLSRSPSRLIDQIVEISVLIP